MTSVTVAPADRCPLEGHDLPWSQAEDPARASDDSRNGAVGGGQAAPAARAWTISRLADTGWMISEGGGR